MVKAASSGIHLTQHDAAIVKGMISRGDRQHDIASWFGVNGGRIAEISTGNTFSGIEPIHEDLPPPGPYLSGKGSTESTKALNAVKNELEHLLEIINRALKTQ